MAAFSPARRVVLVLPNALTVMRLAVAVLFPFMAPGVRLPALIIAAVSDALDGWIARRFGATSWTGALLDAAADKVLAVVVLGTFAVEGLVPLWSLPLLLARDLAVAGIYGLVVLRREWWVFRHIKARMLGKLTTFLVLALVIAVLAWEAAVPALLAAAAVMSIAAGTDYMTVFIRSHRRWAERSSSRPRSAADPSDASRCAPGA
jgi:phosphatidylglycerophosphate synthase